MAVSNYVGSPWPTAATWAIVGTTTEADSTAVASTIGNASVYKLVNASGLANNLARPNQITLPSAGDYWLSALVYIPTGSTGEANLIAASWTGITNLDSTAAATTGQRDQWVLLKRKVNIDAGDLQGRPTIDSLGTTTNTDIVYVDWAGITVEDPSTTIRYPTVAQVAAGTSVWAGSANASTATYTAPVAASSTTSHVRTSQYINRRRRV